MINLGISFLLRVEILRTFSESSFGKESNIAKPLLPFYFTGELRVFILFWCSIYYSNEHIQHMFYAALTNIIFQ